MKTMEKIGKIGKTYFLKKPIFDFPAAKVTVLLAENINTYLLLTKNLIISCWIRIRIRYSNPGGERNGDPCRSGSETHIRTYLHTLYCTIHVWCVGTCTVMQKEDFYC